MLNLDRVFGSAWAVTAEIAALGEAAYRADGAGLRLLVELRQQAGVDKAEAAAARMAARRSANVAIVPILGMVTLRGGVVGCAPTVSSLAMRDQVRELAADSSVHAIVLEFDSPGGEVDGTPELATAIKEARAAKPVVAMVNSIAGSAAYWLASQADQIVVTPSGAVGSIGVYVMHKDDSKAAEAQGMKVTVISAGKYKADGVVGPMSEEGVAYVQAQVDQMHQAFMGDVAKGRGVSIDDVRKGYGQGRMVFAKAAVAQGMADAIGPMDEAIRRAAGLAQERRAASPSALAEGDAIRLRRARG